MKSPLPNSPLLPHYISPFTVIVVFALLALVGVALAPRLSVRLHPSTEGAEVYVNYGYPHATAEAVEMEVTAPLEGMLSMIEGVARVRSVSGDGWGHIALTLTRDAKPEMVRFRALAVIREVYPRLPNGVNYPRVSSQTQEQERVVRLLTYTISSNLSPPVLRDMANEVILPIVSVIEGVSGVEVYGANTNDWYVEYIPELMDRYSISANDIAQAIARYGYLAGVGVESTASGVSVPISIAGPGLSSNAWNGIEVASREGRIITLGQVARVELREREPDGYFRINGQTAITLVVQSTDDANQISTANRVYEAIERVRAQLPPGVELLKSDDSTTHLRTDLRKNFLRTAFSVTILLIFVLIATRNFRYLLVVAVSLTANLAIAIAFYHALNLEIHLYSLSGITLSLGLIIDNTLVMVDHLRHRRNMLVFTAILAATLTTIGALASIFFLDESQRQNLTDFAWVIIVNLSVSLLIGLFMIPSLVDRLRLGSGHSVKRSLAIRFKLRLSKGYLWLAMGIHRFRAIALTIGILGVGLPVFLLPEKIEEDGFWADVYNSTLGSDTYRSDIKPVSDLVLGGSLRLFYNSVWEKGSWGTPERTRVYVRASLPQGGTMEQANMLAGLFESHITHYPEVEQAVTDVGRTRFTIEISFTPEAESGAFPYIIKSRLERVAVTQAGADFSIYGVGLGFSNATHFGYPNSRITLTGYSHQQLMGWARLFADSLRAMPRVDRVWIRGGETHWFTDEYRRYLSIDDASLLAAGIPANRFASELMRLSPRSDNLLWETVDSRVSTVRIRPARGAVPSDFEIKRLPIAIDSTETRTDAVGTFRDELINDQIHKADQQYIITLAYSFIGPDRLVQRVLDQQVEKINSVLPVGFKASQSEWWRWRMDEPKQYIIIALMVLIIFIITSVLFESLRQPLAVILLVPLSFIGVFITYWMFDLAFDQGTYAAFLLLGGLVVNSAIYIINEQNNLAKRYPRATPRSIYIRAVNAKVIPVLLTVISTVLGLLPFVVFGEEQFWFSLATGTIGGLIFSIPALLLFLPALPGGIRRKGVGKKNTDDTDVTD